MPGPAPGVVVLTGAQVDAQPIFSPAAFARMNWAMPPGNAQAWHNRTGSTPLVALATGDRVRLQFGVSPAGGRVRVVVNDFSAVLNLRADQPGEKTLALTTTHPHGRYTALPNFAEGLYVHTRLLSDRFGPMAEISYSYAQQQLQPEANTTVWLYEKR